MQTWQARRQLSTTGDRWNRAARAWLLLALGVVMVGCADWPGAARAMTGPRAARERALERQALETLATSAPLETRAQSFSDLLGRADRSRDAGDVEDATWLYLQALRADPTSQLPIERIGYLELREDPARAALLFEDLIAAHPRSAAAHEGLGLARLATGEADGARRAFDRSLELDPGRASVMNGLGLACDAMGDHSRARRHYLAALELAPRDVHALSNLGLSYMASLDFDVAAEAFRRAIRIAPGSPGLRNQLGFALGRLGRYRDARREFLAAGSEGTTENNLGYVYFLNGRFEEAIAHYESALALGAKPRLTVVRNLMDAQDARESPPLHDWTEDDEVR